MFGTTRMDIKEFEMRLNENEESALKEIKDLKSRIKELSEENKELKKKKVKNFKNKIKALEKR